jgi:hypothetical protein
MAGNLIVPVAADRPEWNTVPPYMFDIHPLGNLMVYESMKGLDLHSFDCIYVTILRKHEDRYGLEMMLKRQFDVAGLRDKLKVVVLENPTRNQPETVARTIAMEGIEGYILIKDADNSFECAPTRENAIGIFPLDALEKVNPSDKSYVALDDSMYVTNIIEKKIIGRYFCAGAYGFKSAEQFMRYYETLAHYPRLYISHIIYAMLLDQISFRPFTVKNYVDWGTHKEWMEYCSGFKTLFIQWRLLQDDKDGRTRKRVNRLYATDRTRIVLVVENDVLREKDIEKAIEQSGIMFHEMVKGAFPHNMQLVSTEYQLLKTD